MSVLHEQEFMEQAQNTGQKARELKTESDLCYLNLSFIFVIILLLYYGYIVTFTKVLTIYLS
jgi:hypothetical protein